MEQQSFFRLQENKNLRTIFFVFFAGVIGLLLYIFQYYLWTFLFALILYLALKPFHDWLDGLVKRRSLSATLVILALFLLVLIPLFFILIALADQTYHFYLLVQTKIESGLLQDVQQSPLVINILQYFDIKETELLQKLTEVVQNTALSAFKGVTGILSFPVSFAVKFFFMLLMLFFLLKDGHNLGSSVYKILPFPDDIEKDIVDRLKEVIKVLMAGNLLIMILQGFLLGLGLAIAGFRSPLLWGTMAAVLSLIPLVGTTFIWIPAVLYLIAVQSYLWALFVGIWCMAWYLLLENLVKPVVFGERLNFHPVVFFFLLLGSIQAFSLPGVIIGPLLLTLFYSLWEIYKLLDVYDLDRKKRSEDSPVITP